MGAHRGRRSEFVGRARELRRLRRAVDDAVAGDGTALFVAGEPGIGKTTLVGEALRRAGEVGARTAWGRCFADAPPFWPWRELLSALAPDADLLRATERATDADDAARFRLFESVGERLGVLARQRPLVLAFDDLQWADVPSLRLLGFVGRGLHDRRVAVVGTYRDVEVADDHPLAALIGELGGAAGVLLLEGLDAEGVRHLRTDRAGAGPAGAELAARVHELTAGNPFFVREVASQLDTRAGPGQPPVVPWAVREALGRQVAACTPGCAELLAAAAVAGPVVDLELIGQVLGRAPAILGEAAAEAQRRRLLATDAGRYRFRHDLVREAVRESLPAARLAALHWGFGEALAARPHRLEEAARHLQAGLLAGDGARATEISVRAAAAATAALGFEQAVEHLRWVLGRAAAGVALPAGLDELELVLQLGDAQLRAGDWQAAGDAFERAAGLARTRGRPTELARAALGFGAGLGGFEVRLLDVRQIALLEEAAGTLDRADPVIGAYVLARLSVALSFVEGRERRERLAEDAIALATRTGDPAARAYALAAWCDVVAGPDHTEQRLAAARDIVRLGTEAGSDEIVLLGSRLAVVALLELGEFGEADHAIGAFERVAERYRLPIVRWYVPLWRGMQALLHGDLDAAERLALQAGEIGSKAGSANAQMLSGSLRMAIAWSRGAISTDFAEAARAASARQLDGRPLPASVLANLLFVAVVSGDLAEARHRLDALAALGFGERDSEWLGTLCTAALACEALGDLELAATVADLAEPYEQRFEVTGIGAVVTCVIGEVLGGIDLARGRSREGEARLRAAIARYEAIGAPLLAARARAALEGRAPVPRHRPSAPPDRAALHRHGDGWLVSYQGRQARLRDSKGVRDLSRLLARPGREIHVSELAGNLVEASSTGPLIDQRAKAAYAARIAELEDEAVDADAAHDPERAARARDERGFLVDELSRAIGIGGRLRHGAGTNERARQAVRARIRYAIDQVASQLPELGRHLTVSVRTGAFCSYAPDREVTWDVRF